MEGLLSIFGLLALICVSDAATICSCKTKSTEFRNFDGNPWSPIKASSGTTAQYDFFSKKTADPADSCYFDIKPTFRDNGNLEEIYYHLEDNTKNGAAGYRAEVVVHANKDVYVNGAGPVTFTNGYFNDYYGSGTMNLKVILTSTGKITVRWYKCDLSSTFHGGATFSIQLVDTVNKNGVPYLINNGFQYQGACGVFNGNTNDDYVGPNGFDFYDFLQSQNLMEAEFLNSWITSSTPAECSAAAQTATSACLDLQSGAAYSSCLSALSTADSGKQIDLFHGCSAAVCYYHDSDSSSMNERVCQFYRKLESMCPAVTVSHPHCDASCGAGETYVLDKPSCENSCDAPNLESNNNCAATSTGHGCVCSDGHVRNSAGTCVSDSQCGCVDDSGVDRAMNLIWSDTSCSNSYKCTVGGVVTSTDKCGSGAECIDGFGCVCYNDGREYNMDSHGFCQWSFSECKVHFNYYIPFDIHNDDVQRRLTPVGEGRYLMIDRTGLNDGCDYKIVLDIDQQREVTAVMMTIQPNTNDQYTVDVAQDKTYTIKLNGALVTSIPGVVISLTTSGRLDVKWWDCNLKAYFPGLSGGMQYYIRAEAPRRTGFTGLCGNVDGDIGNDMISSLGTDLTTWSDAANVLYASWRQGSDPGCSSSASSFVPAYCSVFEDVNGDLGACVSAVEASLVSDLVTACSEHVCNYHDTDVNTLQSRLCDLYQQLLAACGGDTSTYPTTYCDDCGGNGYFDIFGPSCRNTCDNPTAEDSCQTGFGGTCVCDSGFILDSAGACIPYDQCKCIDPENRILTVGESMLSSDCSQHYTCVSKSHLDLPPSIITVPHQCTPHSTCVTSTSTCHCNVGYHDDNGGCKPDVDCTGVAHSIYDPSVTYCTGSCSDATSTVTCPSGVCISPAGCATLSVCRCPAGMLVNENQCTTPPYCPCIHPTTGNPVEVGGIWPHSECSGKGQTCVADEASQTSHITETDQECPKYAFGCKNGACPCLGGYLQNPSTLACDFSFCKCFSETGNFKNFEESSTRQYGDTIDTKPELFPPLKDCTYTLVQKIEVTDLCYYHIYASYDVNGGVTEVNWIFGAGAAYHVRVLSDFTTTINDVDQGDINLYTSTNQLAFGPSMRLYVNDAQMVIKWYDCQVKTKAYGADPAFVQIQLDGGIRPPAAKMGGLCGNCDGNLFNDYLGANGDNLNSVSDDIRDELRTLRNTDQPACGVPTAAQVHSSFLRCEPAAFTGDMASGWAALPTSTQAELIDLCHATVSSLYGGDVTLLDTRLCEFYMMAVDEIAQVGMTVSERPDYCVNLCGVNAAFSLSAECPNTCAQPDARSTCQEPRVSGCRCNDGYVDNAGTCIPADQCGCVYNGYGYGFNVPRILDPTCSEFRVCDAEGNLSDPAPFNCETALPYSQCVQNGLVTECQCPPGWGVVSEPHLPLPHCAAPLNCAGNETYILNATQCPDTCQDPTASDPFYCLDWTTFLPLALVADCSCNDGYLYKTDVGCVLPVDCGCDDEQGFSRSAGDTWMSRHCTAQFSCITTQEGMPPVREVDYGMSCTENNQCFFDNTMSPAVSQCISKDHYNHTTGDYGSWAMESEPAIVCPADTTFDVDTPKCPAHCADLFAHEACYDRKRVPGCRCPDGFVFSTKWVYDEVAPMYQQPSYPSCVPEISCGCYDQDGTQRSIGDEWMSSNCDDLFSCVGIELSALLKITDLNDCSGGTCEPLDSRPANSNDMTCTCNSGYSHRPPNMYECMEDLSCLTHADPAFTGPCSNTCQDPNRSATCTLTMGECVCHSGYYKDGNVCVLPADCPCHSGDTSHPVGSSWLNDDCTTELTCTTNGAGFPTVSTSQHTCGANQQCSTSVPGTCECLPGYQDTDQDGTCDPVVTCHPSAVFNYMTGHCPPTCQQLNGDPTCDVGPGCECPAGEVFYGAECVPPAECQCPDGKNLGDHWPTDASCSAGHLCHRVNDASVTSVVSEPCPEFGSCSNGLCTCREGYTNPERCLWEFSKCHIRWKIGGRSGNQFVRTYDMLYGERKYLSAGQLGPCEHHLSTILDTSSQCYWDVRGTVRPDGTMERLTMQLSDQVNTVNIVIRHTNTGGVWNTQECDVDQQTNIGSTSFNNYLGMNLDVFVDNNGNYQVKWYRCELRVKLDTRTQDQTWVTIRLDDLVTGERREAMTGHCGNADGYVNDPTDYTCPA